MRVKPYVNAPNIGRVGMAFYETIDDPQCRLAYYSQAETNNRWLRDLFFPFISPIDYLKSALDITWSGGCHLAVFEQKMFAGLLRIFSQGASAEPH
ncbi:MAG: hypothetical protein ACWIPH_10500 [Ostreibacterium sp.]